LADIADITDIVDIADITDIVDIADIADIVNIADIADIVLATQLIKAWAQQKGCMQACTIKLSINEDLKLKKGKEKKGLLQRVLYSLLVIWELCEFCVYYNVYLMYVL